MAEAEFVAVAGVDEIQPGERMIVEIDGKWIVILNVDGQFYAIADLCSHDDGPLSEGVLFGCEIECPRHGARFDIRNGKVLCPPALVDIPAYDVRVENDELQISRKSRPKA